MERLSVSGFKLWNNSMNLRQIAGQGASRCGFLAQSVTQRTSLPACGALFPGTGPDNHPQPGRVACAGLLTVLSAPAYRIVFVL